MADVKQDPRRPKGDTGIAEIYNSSMGSPPMDDDMGSVPKYLKEKKPSPPITAAPAAKPAKKAGGGSIKSASSRADGCCVRGKTRA